MTENSMSYRIGQNFSRNRYYSQSGAVLKSLRKFELFQGTFVYSEKRAEFIAIAGGAGGVTKPIPKVQVPEKSFSRIITCNL